MDSPVPQAAPDWNSLSTAPPTAAAPSPDLTQGGELPLPSDAPNAIPDWNKLSPTAPPKPGVFDRGGLIDNIGSSINNAVDNTGNALKGMMGADAPGADPSGTSQAVQDANATSAGQDNQTMADIFSPTKVAHAGAATLATMGAGAQDLANTIGSGVGMTLKGLDNLGAPTNTYDWWNKNMQAPAEAQGQADWQTASDESKKGGLLGAAGQLIGNVADQMAEMVLGGGEAKGVSIVSDYGKTAFQTVRDTIASGLATSAKMSRLPAAVEATKTYKSIYDQTGDPLAAAKGSLTSAGTMMVGNTLPMSVEGPLMYRLISGGFMGATNSEFQRQVNNTATPDNMQQPFSWPGMATNTVAGSAMGGAFGHTAPEDYQIAVLRYNGIHDAAQAGNEGAKRAATVIADLTHVDGLNNAAVDAAVHGVTHSNAKMAQSHPELMANDPRYASIFNATQNGPASVDPVAGEAIARDAYAMEVSSNAAWDHYTKVTGLKAQSIQMAANARIMMDVAQKTVPPEELNILGRWAQHDNPSQLQFNAALRHTVETKVAPDYVHDRYDGDYGPDGVPNETALSRDASASHNSFDAFYAPSPKVEKALKDGGINYYRMNDGRLAIRGGSAEYTSNVFAHVFDATKEVPLKPGEVYEKPTTARDVTGNKAQKAKPDGGDLSGVKAGNGTEGEVNVVDGKQAGNEGNGAGVRAGDKLGNEGNGSANPNPEDLTPRAQPVAKALAKAGVDAPVSPTGRVTIAPDLTTEKATATMDVAANDAAESSLSGRKTPTDAQRSSGNYPVGKILFPSEQGDIPVDIENPAGSIRRSLDGAPKKWQRKMLGVHYGRIPGTISADGEPLDVMLTRAAHDPSLPIAVISQHDPATGKFDELKVVMGTNSKSEAMEAYARQYPPGMREKLIPNGKSDVTMMPRAKFAKFIKSGATDVAPHPISGEPMLKLRENADFTGHTGMANQSEMSDKVDAVNAKHGTALAYDPSSDQVKGTIPRAKAGAIHRSLSRIDGYEGSEINGKPIEKGHDVAGAGEESAGAQGARATDGNQPAGHAGNDRQVPPEAPSPEGIAHVASDAPVFQEGQGAHPVSVVGVHYSNTPDLTELDPGMAGSGSSGAERKRFGRGVFGKSADIMSHMTHFYVRESAKLPPKENVVAGTHPYEARLNNLYDLRTDPDGIVKKAQAENRGMNMDSILEDIHDAGYDGVLHDSLPGMAAEHMATVFGVKGKIPVKDVSEYTRENEVKLRDAEKIEREAAKKELRQKVGEKVLDEAKKKLGEKLEADEGPRAMFAGEGSHTKDVAALARAKAVQEAHVGKLPQSKLDEITHKNTGWSKGADGKWRYEISDDKSDMKLLKGDDFDKLGSLHGMSVDKVIDHPELFAAYPELKDVKVSTSSAMIPKHIGAMYDEDSNTIFMHKFGSYPKGGNDSALSIIHHELQHAIQHNEGHATGGSSAEFVDKIRVEQIEKVSQLRKEADWAEISRKDMPKDSAEYKAIGNNIDSFKAQVGDILDQTPEELADLAKKRYMSLAGEQEAYNTQHRQTMTAAERRMMPPAFSEKIARNAQIVRFDNKNALSEGANHETDSRATEATPPGAEPKGLPGRGGLSGSEGRLAPERAAQDEVPPVTGLPRNIRVNGKVETFGPVARAVKAAQDYAKESGIDYHRPDTYAKVDEVRATRIAAEFERMEHAPNDPIVKKAYKAMVDETLAQWQAIKKTGLKIDFIKPDQADPYGNPRNAILDVRDNNHLWVYPTESGFGSSDKDVSDNPLLQPTGETINGHKLLANDVFRIVHDYFGHIKEGFGFRAEGEENAWRSHSEMYSPLARRAMTSETRGQNSWVNYGPHAEANRTASGADTHYADQKVGLMPEWVSHEGSPAEERTNAEIEQRHAAVNDHIATVKAAWKGAPEMQAVRSRAEVPDQLRGWMDDMLPPGEDPAGLYHNGKVYLFSSQLHNPAEIGRVIMHEVVGHFGLRGTFGSDLNGFLDSVHGSIKDLPAYHEIFDQYRDAYAGRAGAQMHRAATEEYLAKIAEDGSHPGVMAKLVAWVRQWGRDHGMVNHWTDADLKAVMGRVASDVREGRVSVAGLESAETHFNDDTSVATSTYHGAAGRGTIDQHYDGTRELHVGTLDATVHNSVLDGKLILSVSDLSHGSPEDIARLSRFAAEEGRMGVAIGKENVTKAQIEASGVPYTSHPGFYELKPGEQPASPMFALRNRAKADPATEDVLNKFIDHTGTNMTAWDRMQHTMRAFRDDIQHGDTALELKQSWQDALASIEKLERAQNGGLLMDAAQSAYKSAWLAKNNEQITAGVLKLGVPEYKAGSFEPVAGRKGLLDALAPLYKTADGKSLDRLFEGYIGAHRANELYNQFNRDGTRKEQLLTRPEIDRLMALDQKYPVFKQVMADVHAFQNQLLDLAVNRGTMSKEIADQWKQNMYVPFYRSMGEEEGTHWRSASKSLSGKKVTSRKIYGSQRQVEPIIENIVKNTSAILDKIYSNEAMRRVVGLADGIGMERVKMPMQAIRMSVDETIAQLAKAGIVVDKSNLSSADLDMLTTMFRPTKPIGPDIVSVVENGKNLYYRVTDPLLYRSVTAFQNIGQFDKILNTILGVTKKVYTVATTLNPKFMFRIMLKDAMQSWIQTGTNPNMFSGVMKNAKDIYTDGRFLNELRVAGYNGNEYYRIHELRSQMQDLGGNGWTLLNSPKKIYQAYHRVGWLSEQLSRIKIAKHTLETGGSMAEAAWQAQNTVNWQRRGDGRAAQLIMRGAPFLNAHIQGLARIYEGALGRDVTSNRSRAVTSFLLKSAGIAAASLALAYHNQGDKRYERLSEEAKDLYWHIFAGDNHYVIPKPFEIGGLVGTMPERVMRAMDGTDDAHEFLGSVGRLFSEAFGLNPTPVAVLPIAEDIANKDLHTGTPIVSQSIEHLQPGAQYLPTTPHSVVDLAHMMPSAAPDALRSPVRLQHLIRGYTSSLGMYMMQMADAVVNTTGSHPPAPASRFGGGALGNAVAHITGFSHPSTDTQNKYIEQVYEAQKSANEAAATMNHFIKQGDLADAREVMGNDKTMLAYRSQISAMAKQMTEMHKMEMMIYQSKTMTPAEKRERLDQINKLRINYLDRAGPMLQLINDQQ